jgi:hypothetical protein
MPEDNNVHIQPAALYYAQTPLNIYIYMYISVFQFKLTDPKFSFGNLKAWIKLQF